LPNGNWDFDIQDFDIRVFGIQDIDIRVFGIQDIDIRVFDIRDIDFGFLELDLFLYTRDFLWCRLKANTVRYEAILTSHSKPMDILYTECNRAICFQSDSSVHC